MCGYTKDLMMAIVVGGTAFIGLTPVLFKQIVESELKRPTRLALLLSLAVSVIFGVLSVLLAVLWFEEQGRIYVLWSSNLFAAEVGVCSVVALIFMLLRIGKIEPSKPATRTARPLSSQERGLRSAWGSVIAVLGIAISLLFQGLAWRGDWNIETLGNCALTFGSVFVVAGLVLLVLLCRRIKKQ